MWMCIWQIVTLCEEMNTFNWKLTNGSPWLIEMINGFFFKEIPFLFSFCSMNVDLNHFPVRWLLFDLVSQRNLIKIAWKLMKCKIPNDFTLNEKWNFNPFTGSYSYFGTNVSCSKLMTSSRLIKTNWREM